MLVLAIIVSLIVPWPVLSAFKQRRRHRLRLRLLRSAIPLSNDCKPGDLVKFSGRLGYPQLTTPVTSRAVGYFRMVLRAHFKRKRKKPASGMETHRPILHVESSDHQPLMLTANSGVIVHLNLSKPWEQFQDLEKAETSLDKIPPQFTALKQSKHEGYELTEAWYPPEQRLFAVGVLIDRSRAGVCIGAAEDEDSRQLLSSRLEADLVSEAQKGIRSAWTTVFMMGLMLVAAWGFYVR